MTQNKKKKIFDIILNIILILLAILIIYWFIKLIFGGSPEFSEFNFALIIFIGGFLFKIYREIGEIKVGIKYSFNKIKEDMNSLKENMSLIKKKLKI